MKKIYTLLVVLLTLALCLSVSEASNGGAQFVKFGPYYDSTNDVSYEGVKIYHYNAGTTDNRNCWLNENKTTPCRSPEIDDGGTCDVTANDGFVGPMYCDGDYDIVVCTSDDSDCPSTPLYTFSDWNIAQPDHLLGGSTTSGVSDTGKCVNTSYPSASSANRFQICAKTDASNNLLEVGMNKDGASFSPLIGQEYLDPNSYTSINAAVAACSEETMLIYDAQTLAASLTIPADCSIKIIRGGSIAKASTYTLRIDSTNFEAGNYQVFTGFSAGDIFFGADTKEINFRWFGALGDGTDDSPEIQMALDSLLPGYGTDVICTPGVYGMATVVNYPTTTSQQGDRAQCGAVDACGAASFRIIGATSRDTNWTGCSFKALTDSMTMFNFASSTAPARYADNFEIEDIQLDGNSLATLMMQTGNATVGSNATGIRLRDLQWTSPKAGGTALKTGVTGGGSTVDFEIYSNKFEFGNTSTSNIAIDYSGEGLSVFGSNIASGQGKGVVLNAASEMDFYGTIFNANNVALFATNNTGGAVQCFGCWFEDGNTAIYDNDFAGDKAMFPMSFFDCHLDVDDAATNLFDFTNHGESGNRAQVYFYGGTLGEAGHDMVLDQYTDVHVNAEWARTDVDWVVTAGGTMRSAETYTRRYVLTAAQVNALRGSPYKLVGAIGTDYWIEFVSALVVMDHTAAFTVAADEDFVIQYTSSGQDVTASIETTGFLDAGNDETRWYPSTYPTAGDDIEGELNDGLEIFNTGAGETADGAGSTLEILLTYRIHRTGL